MGRVPEVKPRSEGEGSGERAPGREAWGRGGGHTISGSHTCHGPAPLTPPHARSRPGPCPPASHSVRKGNHNCRSLPAAGHAPCSAPPHGNRSPARATRPVTIPPASRAAALFVAFVLLAKKRPLWKPPGLFPTRLRLAAPVRRLRSVQGLRRGLSRALRRGPRASREAVPAQRAHWAQVPAGSDLRSGAHPSKTSAARIPEEALSARAPGLRALGRAPHAPHSITRALADFNRRASHPWLKGTEPMGPWIQVAD